MEWLPVIAAFFSGVIGAIITNKWSDHRLFVAETKEAEHAVHGYILALDRYSELLWALGMGNPETDDFPAYRPEKDLLNPGTREELATTQLAAAPYFYMLKFATEDDRKTALETTIPSGSGHPIPDAQICDQRVRLLKDALNRGLDLKALR